MAGRNYEKMLPRSYSIAAWQQWVCITSDTVWCITTTDGRIGHLIALEHAVSGVPEDLGEHQPVGLILLNRAPQRLSEHTPCATYLTLRRIRLSLGFG